MQPEEIYNYLNGMCAAIYFLTCLICGLQLSFGIFSQGRHSNTALSKIVGGCMLAMSFSAVCYVLSNLFVHLSFLYCIGTSIDIFLFTGYAVAGYALYTNNEPSRGKLIVLSLPFAIFALLNICCPTWLDVLFFVAAAVLFSYFLYFGVALQRREQVLDDLYADPELHSLRWIWTVIGLFVGWWIVSMLFQFAEALSKWYLCAMYIYMSGLFMFVFAKVNNSKQPVSLATQQEFENLGENQNENADQCEGHNVARLIDLMEREQLYLNPDLTVEEVVKRLGTNTKYFSAMLHDELHTTFAQMVNSYRVEKAKDILKHTDTKVEFVGERCGFNSRQSFHRVFVKTTGKTPAEWREQ